MRFLQNSWQMLRGALGVASVVARGSWVLDVFPKQTYQLRCEKWEREV